MTTSSAINDLPLISVILPNYNHARFLAQRWESVINQSMQDFEIILLDDASRDNSQSILESFAQHPKVSQFIVNASNSGSPFAQWERGIRLCRGRYIWIAETDDWASSDFLACLLNGIPDDAVIAHTGSHRVDDQGNFIDKSPNLTNEAPLIRTGEDFIANTMQIGNGIPNASAAIFCRKNALKISTPTNMRYCGDWVFWIRLAMLGSVYSLPNRLNYFRCHIDSTRPEQSHKEKAFVETIDRPEYLKEFIAGAVEAYRALGNRWDPLSIEKLASQISVIDARYPFNNLRQCIPNEMWQRYNLSIRQRHSLLRRVIRRLGRMCKRYSH